MKTNTEIIELLLPTLLELSEPGEDYKSLHLTLSVGNEGPKLELGVYRSKAETIARGSSFEEVAKAIEQLKPEIGNLIFHSGRISFKITSALTQAGSLMFWMPMVKLRTRPLCALWYLPLTMFLAMTIQTAESSFLSGGKVFRIFMVSQG